MKGEIKIGLLLFFVVFSTAAMFYFVPKEVSAAWIDAAFSYRKSITWGSSAPTYTFYNETHTVMTLAGMTGVTNATKEIAIYRKPCGQETSGDLHSMWRVLGSDATTSPKIMIDGLNVSTGMQWCVYYDCNTCGEPASRNSGITFDGTATITTPYYDAVINVAGANEINVAHDLVNDPAKSTDLAGGMWGYVCGSATGAGGWGMPDITTEKTQPVKNETALQTAPRYFFDQQDATGNFNARGFYVFWRRNIDFYLFGDGNAGDSYCGAGFYSVNNVDNYAPTETNPTLAATTGSTAWGTSIAVSTEKVYQTRINDSSDKFFGKDPAGSFGFADKYNIAPATIEQVAMKNTTTAIIEEKYLGGYAVWFNYENDTAAKDVAIGLTYPPRFTLGTQEEPPSPDAPPPKYSNVTATPASPTIYSPTTQYKLNITVTDNLGKLSYVILETNRTGTLVNYTNASSVTLEYGDNFQYNWTDQSAGTFVYKWYMNDSVGNANSTSQYTYTISQGAPTCTLSMSPGWSATYPATTTPTCICNNGESGVSVGLYKNNSVAQNNTGVILAVATHQYKCNSTSTANYTNGTASNALVISKSATFTATIASDMGWNITYPSGTTITGSNADATDTACSYQLLRNGTAKTNPYNVTESAGTYNYTYYRSGCQNMTINQTSNTLTITPATTTCSLGLSSTSVTYGTPITAYCTCDNPQVVSVNFTRNGTSVLSTNNTAVTLGVGAYNYMCNKTDTNYSTASATNVVTVAQAPATCALSLGATNIIYGTALTPSCTCTASQPATMNFTRNGTAQTNHSAVYLEVGSHNYMCNKTDTNYTTASDTGTVAVTQTLSQAYPTYVYETNITQMTFSIDVGTNITDVKAYLHSLIPSYTWFAECGGSGDCGYDNYTKSGAVGDITYMFKSHVAEPLVWVNNTRANHRWYYYLTLSNGTIINDCYPSSTYGCYDPPFVNRSIMWAYWIDSMYDDKGQIVEYEPVKVFLRIGKRMNNATTTVTANYTFLNSSGLPQNANSTVYADDKEYNCIASGGTVSTSSCCLSVGDYPNTCNVGACACAPADSHTVRTCEKAGYPTVCWNGDTFYQSGQPLNATYKTFNAATFNSGANTLATLENRTYYGNITMRFLNSYRTAVSNPYYLPTYQMNITNCSGDSASTYMAMNMFLKDEANLTAIAGTFDYTVKVWHSSESNYRNYSFHYDNAINSSFCIYPAWTWLTVDLTAQYGSTGYSTRSYYLETNVTNATQFLDFALLKNAFSYPVVFFLRDQWNNPQTDYTINIQRLYLGNGSYKTVAVCKSDSPDGKCTSYLNLQDVFYKYLVQKGGLIALETSPTTVICSPFESITSCPPYPILLKISSAGTANWFKYIGKIAYSCSVNEATNTLRCTVADTSGLVSSYNLFVTKKNNLLWDTLCNQNETSSAVTFTCALGNRTGNLYYYSLQGYMSFPPTMISSDYIDYTSLGTEWGWGSLGYLMAFLLIGTLFFVGIYNPVVALSMAVLGVIVSFYLNLLPIGVSSIVTIALIVATMVWRARA